MPWNMNQFYNNWNTLEKFPLMPFLVPVVIWSTFWKGLALYHSARKQQKMWFVVLLVVNTLGILEIIYLLFISDLLSAKKNSKK